MLSYFPTTIGVALKGGCRFFVPNVVGVILGYRKQYEPGFPDKSWGESMTTLFMMHSRLVGGVILTSSRLTDAAFSRNCWGDSDLPVYQYFPDDCWGNPSPF